MSPNGTLLAYSKPVDIKELRDQAALISIAWKDHDTALRQRAQQSAANGEAGSSASQEPGLETLTIEFDNNNILVRAVQPKLLLVLVGGVPPSRKINFTITPESYGGSRYPSDNLQVPQLTSLTSSSKDRQNQRDTEQPEGGSSFSKSPLKSPAKISSQSESNVNASVLHMQRTKLDALCEFLRKDFESKGFVMPDDNVFP